MMSVVQQKKKGLKMTLLKSGLLYVLHVKIKSLLSLPCLVTLNLRIKDNRSILGGSAPNASKVSKKKVWQKR